MSKIVLSVCVRSYNQKEYLRRAIDSILSQITNFEFEIIVSDDCSTDGTLEMLHEYVHLYPDKIRLVLGKQNIGGPNNFKRVIESSTAKYVAFMDGDDYWVDDFKLQKQFNFMESHPEYVGCFHNAYTISDIDDISVHLFNNSFITNPVTYQPIITERWFMPTSSEFVVREKIIFPEWYSDVANDDYVINLGLAMSGDFYYMPDLMSVYRYHSANISKIYKDTKIRCINFIKIYTEYSKLYPTDVLPLFENKITEYTQMLSKYEQLIERPWLRYLDSKTYKRAIKRELIRLFSALYSLCQ